MGPSTDPMAVVSTTGKVYGVSSLRLVDASTFPILPPGHIQATVCKYNELSSDVDKNARLTMYGLRRTSRKVCG